MNVANGPKISSWQIRDALFGANTAVGSMNQPREGVSARRPPVRRLAPSARAMST